MIGPRYPKRHSTAPRQNRSRRKETIMAAGAKPALDPTVENQAEKVAPTPAKPATFKDRIVQKLMHIFEHNEQLGSTRQ